MNLSLGSIPSGNRTCTLVGNEYKFIEISFLFHRSILLETRGPVTQLGTIDLRLLRVFVGVVESGGYSAAQSALNIGLPTISAHMTTLEGRLGFRLCQRGRAGFNLTDKGRIVYEEAKQIFAALDDFNAATETLRGRLAGQLNIGIVDATVTSEHAPLYEIIRKFNQRENYVQINLMIDSRTELERAVIDGRLHMAIGPFVHTHVGLAFTPLYAEVQEVYCGQGHPLFDKPPHKITKKEIAKSAVVSRGYSEIDDCDRIGSRNRRATVYILEAQLMLLLSGGYIGYLPTHFASPWVRRGGLTAIGSKDLRYESQFSLIVKTGIELNPLAIPFIEDLNSALMGAPA